MVQELGGAVARFEEVRDQRIDGYTGAAKTGAPPPIAGSLRTTDYCGIELSLSGQAWCFPARFDEDLEESRRVKGDWASVLVRELARRSLAPGFQCLVEVHWVNGAEAEGGDYSIASWRNTDTD